MLGLAPYTRPMNGKGNVMKTEYTNAFENGYRKGALKTLRIQVESGQAIGLIDKEFALSLLTTIDSALDIKVT